MRKHRLSLFLAVLVAALVHGGGSADEKPALSVEDKTYLDGLTLFAEPDLDDLPDGLHPNAAGLRRMGERFAALAFAPGGAFAKA